MLSRILAITLNQYRESVRARLLHGLFALALLTAGYALVVGAYAFRDTLRVVSDLGAASVSFYALVTAVVISGTSLYRELEHKTIFPILARPIRRWEYLVGKYLGTCLVVAVFIAADTGVLMMAEALESGRSWMTVLLLGALGTLVTLVAAVAKKSWRTMLPIPWALGMFALGYLLATTAPDDRRVLSVSALLTLFEVGIVTAVGLVFASFSSPFLSSLFTVGVVVVGRSADSLAHLPPRVFGAGLTQLAALIGRVVPNLMLYVPSRPLLTGEVLGQSLASYVLRCGLHAFGWALALLALASWLFRRRDFV